MLHPTAADGFTLAALTEAVMNAPYKASRISSMGLFAGKGIAENYVSFDEKNGEIALVPSKSRREPATPAPRQQRTNRVIAVPHFPLGFDILAEDYQGVRAFGSSDEGQAYADAYAEKLAEIRQHYELTWEWLRLGAVKGTILDGDMSTTLVNLFTEFGVSQTTVTFELDVDTTDVRAKCLEAVRAVELGLGNLPFDHVHAVCGKTFFEQLISHPEVKYAYQYYDEGSYLRSDPRSGFPFGGITWEEYRGSVGGTAMVSATAAHIFAVGAPGLFAERYAPANYKETVNTVGLPLYVKTERMPFDKGDIGEAQSNVLAYCTRPKSLVLGANT